MTQPAVQDAQPRSLRHHHGGGRTRRGMSRAAGDHQSLEQRDRWLLSYADLVTLLFALFVVLYAAADHERARVVARDIAAEFGDAAVFPSGGAENSKNAPLVLTSGGTGILPANDRLTEARHKLDQALAANPELAASARVTVTERGVVVSLAEAGFFAAGEAEVRPEALPLLDALADTLDESDNMLRVEGHTDSTPIATARYPSNWELSAARASNVLAHLTRREHHPIASARLSVAGYAGERPVADNTTPEGRALNRRVDLVIPRTND